MFLKLWKIISGSTVSFKPWLAVLGGSGSINAEMQHANCNWERKWQVFPPLRSGGADIDVFCILEANDKSAASVFQEADLQALPCKLKMAACLLPGGWSQNSPSRAEGAGGSLGCHMNRGNGGVWMWGAAMWEFIVIRRFTHRGACAVSPTVYLLASLLRSLSKINLLPRLGTLRVDWNVLHVRCCKCWNGPKINGFVSKR